MARIGTDPDDLKALSGKLDSLGAQLQRSGVSIDSTLVRTRWYGPDAERFRHLWANEHRASITRAVTECARVSEILTRNADEQVIASDDSGSTGGADAGSIEVLGLSVGSVASGSVGLGSPQRPVPAGRSGPTRWVPDEVVSFGLGAEGSVASIVAVGDHDVRVESRGEERLVTITTRDAIGVRGSVGGRLMLGPIDADLSAYGDALLGIVTRNAFETDPGGVATTIIRAELEGVGERLNATMGLIPIPMAPVLGQISGALTTLGRTVGLLPEPVRTETLVELAVTGSMAAAPPVGPGGRATVDGIVRMGASTGPTSEVLVVEAEGKAALALSANVGKNDIAGVPSDGRVQSGSPTPDQTHEARLEIRTEDQGVTAVLRVDTSDGSQVRRTTMEFSDRPGIGTAAAQGLRSAAADIRGGRLDSALEELTKLRLADVASSTTQTTYSLSKVDGTAGGSLGAGAEFGGLVTARGSTMTRTGPTY